MDENFAELWKELINNEIVKNVSPRQQKKFGHLPPPHHVWVLFCSGGCEILSFTVDFTVKAGYFHSYAEGRRKSCLHKSSHRRYAVLDPTQKNQRVDLPASSELTMHRSHLQSLAMFEVFADGAAVYKKNGLSSSSTHTERSVGRSDTEGGCVLSRGENTTVVYLI